MHLTSRESAEDCKREIKIQKKVKIRLQIKKKI